MSAVSHPSPRWRTHGLPAEVTSFVGRRREVADVKRLLPGSRLVTLTGVGGVGKTRLAYRVAAELCRAFPDGVWPVELAELENPELLAQAVSAALGVEDHSGRPPVEALTDHLRDMTALIVLDNCEHLLPECAVLADALLRASSSVRVLATSRQLLGIPGEQTLDVQALPLPGADPGSVEASTRYDAVRLFVDRARAVRPGFALTEDNRQAVERLCRRLDGVPLAIELAAVRLRALSVQQLLGRLDDRFRLLERRSCAAVERHRTLWALIDWSHTLCTPEERLLWARASVFVGGFDLETAEEVCAGDGIAREEVLNLVAGLVDKSVLITEETPFGVRYRLMESLREYGRERLAECGGTDAVQRRHRDHFARMCADTLASESCQLKLLSRVKLETANLRSAMDYCFGTAGDAAYGLRMAADLRNHWLSGYLGEGRQRLAQGLALHHAADEARGRALAVDGWLAVVDGRPDEAVRLFDEAREIGERLGHGVILADVALQQGLLALDRGDAETAITLCRAADARHRATGDIMGRIRASLWLAGALTLTGDLDAAVRTAQEGIALCEAHAKSLYRAHLLTMLGVAFWRRGDTGRAGTLVRESLTFHRELGNSRGIGLNMAVLAWITAADGRYERAARLLGIFERFSREPRSRQAIGAQVAGYRHLRPYQEECVAEIRRALGETDFEAKVRGSARLDVDQALSYALEESAGDDVAEAAGPADGACSTPLTRRQTEVARLIGRGLTNRDIAAELVISQRTAEGHVEQIMHRLGFGSRSQIAVWISEHDGRNGTEVEHRGRHLR
ncbi:LuxR family transcriptional regulator [Actinoallomurus iriomotensis]|uniref:LuxR family transcriptional regulator n=1 Tax=Actinoallomurus iriomotensis TaxID=478107 RepID=A0A9W6S1L8_9ACTN|nr:LuxR family transcriptional regulator [Actinoallomurus iriomotensis]